MSQTNKDGLRLLGVGAAACAACCAGPLLAFLSGLTVAGVASTVFIGGAGIAIAVVAATAFLVLRRRRANHACAVDAPEPVPVAATRGAGIVSFAARNDASTASTWRQRR